MSLTPSNPRMTNHPWGLRATPSTSPFIKTSPAKSSRTARMTDAGLSLRRVIGTTASSPNAIDTLSSARSLAYTAGAAAVITTFDRDFQLTQRFYRARPTALPLNPSPSIYEPSTPTSSSEFRKRPTGSLRDAGGATGSPFGTPSADYNDASGSKTWAARERVKAATCVSFSPDGKYLAVGETGYRPRVLLFSTSKEASPYTPLTSLSDHTFGVKCIAFSPNSQYLASLGTANDGFLYIWSINNRNGAASLYASNKCTSNIFQIAWMGTTLVTVGTRHVKVWRVDGSGGTTPVKAVASFVSTNSSQKLLSGRNCLLGPLLEATFTAVVGVSKTKAIVCSDRGDICLLDDSDGNQRFVKVADAGFAVTAAALMPGGHVLLAGTGGATKTFELDVLLQNEESEPKQPLASRDAAGSDADCIVALSVLGNHIVMVDGGRVIKIVHSLSHTGSEPPSITLQLPAHGGPVQGVRPFPGTDSIDASFFTWATDGTILFWNPEGACKHTIQVELEQTDVTDDFVNELKVVRLCPRPGILVTGDKCGVLRMMDQNSGACKSSFRAHAGEITDIAVYETKDMTLIASSGRDRVVQIFSRSGENWDLLQTLDEHVGAVTGLLFTSDGNQLLSCSSDRTVVVREALTRTDNGKTIKAFMILRTITLKATPVSMTLPSDRDDILIISTIDRNVHRYNLGNGQSCGSFKAADADGGDAVVVSSLVHVPTYTGQNLVAGVCGSDKSIRLYDENGTLLGRDWGHTEGVTDLTLITPKNDAGESGLVTVAADGTVFIWNFGLKGTKNEISRSMDLMGVSSLGKELVVNRPPLRRVLSQTEMARFQQRSPDQDVATPTGKPRLPKLEKKSSRFSLAQAPRLDPSPLTTYASRRRQKDRSPSPPSPRTSRRAERRPSMEVRSRFKTSFGDTGGLGASTDSVCRNLRAYRKKLATSSEHLSAEALRELERELGLTARAVGEKAMKSRNAVEENAMVKLLSQYSERLLEMLDEKFSASLAKQSAMFWWFHFEGGGL
ncbi:WD40 repeat-like protein [Trichodelitschia bisporula]|uniref:WD40 repeat-like protein n=1 Tax=Trichodelitschia bisporula TaxID=703511 RepID=A0A6G1IA83_9PEZI|nr:WD40 repeat-like protein [Trichodelitschia bisporula]